MRYDVWRLSDGALIVELQHQALQDFNTRVVAPLRPVEAITHPYRGLHPKFIVGGAAYIMETHLLGAIFTQELKEHVANIGDEGDKVTAALDLMFTGF